MSAIKTPVTVADLADLLEKIQAVGRDADRPAPPPVGAAWAPIARQTVHEWLAPAPPQTLLIDLAAAATGRQTDRSSSGMRPCDNPADHDTETGAVFWVGRACRPYAVSLAQGRAGRAKLLERSVFVDVPVRQRGARVWAIDLLLRSPAALAVIADGRDLDMAQSRRLQLAAEAGRSIALLWRRDDEARALSAAHYRWQVTPRPTPGRHPRWRIECLRRKHNPLRGNASPDDEIGMTNGKFDAASATATSGGGGSGATVELVPPCDNADGQPQPAQGDATFAGSAHGRADSAVAPEPGPITTSGGTSGATSGGGGDTRTALRQDGTSNIYLVEFRGAEGVVPVSAELADRSRASQSETAGPSRRGAHRKSSGRRTA